MDVEKEDGVSPAKPKRGRKGNKQEEEDKAEEVVVKEEPALSPTRPSTRVGSRERTSTRQGGSSSTATASPQAPKGKESSRRSKQRSEDESGEEDPYAFKEPEPFEDKGKAQTAAKGDEAKTKKSSLASPQTPSRGSKRESDSADSSSDEAAKKTRSNSRPTRGSNKDKASEEGSGSLEVKPEDDETSTDTKEESGAETELAKSEKTESVKEEDVKKEAKDDKEDGKSLLHMTKKQRELFPFLSAIKTTTVENLSNRSSTRSSAAAAATSAQQLPKSAEKSREKSPQPPAASVPKSRSRSHSPSAAAADAKSSPASKGGYPRRGGKRRKTPRKPNSSEIVESESESEAQSDDDSKTKSATTAAASNQAKRKQDPQETEEEAPRKSAAKRSRKDDQDDMDLECGETIPGSPVHPSSGTSDTASPPSKVAKSTPAPAQGGRLEMPFATVPDGPKEQVSRTAASTSSSSTSATAAIPATLPPRRTYPPAARAPGGDGDDDLRDDSSASQSPKPPATAGNAGANDGSKSPADSSEVDMESVNGRKAESEDSKLDVESASEAAVATATGGRKPVKKKASGATPNSPASIAKRKRRPREAALRGAARGRGRYLGRFGKGGAHDDETDEAEEQRGPGFANLESLDNVQLKNLTEKFHKTAKNKDFFVPFGKHATLTIKAFNCLFKPDLFLFTLDPNNLGSNDRIADIQSAMDAIKKRHAVCKRDMALLDRRRKKLRRKERSAHNSGSNESSNNTDSGDNRGRSAVPTSAVASAAAAAAAKDSSSAESRLYLALKNFLLECFSLAATNHTVVPKIMPRKRSKDRNQGAQLSIS